MSSSKKDHPYISSANDLPIISAIQSTIIDAAKKLEDDDANPSICCTHCQDGDDEHNDAVQFCQDYKLPLCDSLVIAHQKNKNTKDHTLEKTALKNLVQSTEVRNRNFYAKCDELIFRDCAVIDHDGHKKTHIDTASNQERVNLKQLIMQTQKDVNPVEKSLSEVIEMMQKIEKKCENECKKVEQEAKKLKEHIDQRATKLLNEIKDLKKMKLKNLELQKEHLSQMITTAKIDDIAFVDHSDNIELLNLKN